MEQQTVIFLGPQGSGKGTQVELFKRFLQEKDPGRNIVHFEAGKALRAFGEEGGHTPALVNASLRRGELQPMFILAHVMARVFIAQSTGNDHFVVDGFPRTSEQLALFDSAMHFYQQTHPTLLFINISVEAAVRRLMARGRSDDSESSIRTRLSWTREQVMPTIAQFRKDPEYRFIEINGERTIEEVHRDILNNLQLS